MTPLNLHEEFQELRQLAPPPTEFRLYYGRPSPHQRLAF